MADTTCHAPIRAAVGDRLTPDEIDALIERVKADLDTATIERGVARRLKAMKRDLTPAQVRAIIAKTTHNALKEGLIERRVKAYAAKSRALRDAIIAAMPDQVHGKAFDAADKLRAYNAGADALGTGLGLSVEAEAKGRFSVLLTPLDEALERSGAKGLLDPLFNKAAREAFEDKVAVEIARANGADVAATGDHAAETIGKALATAGEAGRIMQNNEGAWIDKLPGYVARQNHDALKVSGGFWNLGAGGRARAFTAWRAFITPLLDEATFADLGHYDFDERLLARHDGDVRAAFLETVWNNIVLSSRIGDVGSDFEYEFKTPASKARSVSAGRTLHFKDPQAWLSYHRRFGQGSLYGVIVRQLEGAARNSALLHRWGPNPEAAFAAHIDRAVGEVRNAQGAAGVPTVNKLKGQGVESLAGNLHNEWEVLTGKAGAPAELRIAAIGNAIRVDQRLSKLGGAVLASLGPDQAIAAHVFRQHGGQFLDGYRGAFSGVLQLDRATKVEVGRMLGIGAREAAMEMASRFDAADGVSGMSSALTNMLFKATGFESVMNGHRRGLASMWSTFAASHADKVFGELPPAFRDQLDRFGVTAADWEAVRKNVTTLSDGNRYLHFDGLSGDLGIKMRAYMAQFLDDSLTEPGIREQAKLTLGTKRGDVLGEAVRCFTQFKAYPVTYLTRHFSPAISAVRAGDSGAVMNMAHLLVASTLFGYLAMQAKQLSKGLTPRPLIDDDGHWRADTWIAALLQGGGLGIYGDFLFGEYSRAGGVVETLAGPSVASFADIVKLVSKVARVDEYQDNTPTDIASDAVGVLKANTPFLNVWFLRYAIDTTVMHLVQDQISPGYAGRYQDRMKQQQGTQYLLPQ